MDKKSLSERDICTKFITPALEVAGWDIATQVREEFPLTKGRIIVRGNQLMTLCDTLEQQIDAATGKQTELLDAVMAKV